LLQKKFQDPDLKKGIRSFWGEGVRGSKKNGERQKRISGRTGERESRAVDEPGTHSRVRKTGR